MECGAEMETELDDSQDPQQQQPQNQSLEYLLLARNRSLMNENTQTKLALTNEKEKASSLDRDNGELKHQVTELKSLVSQLEEHLLKVNAVGAAAGAAAAAGGGSRGSSVDVMILPVRSEGEGLASPPLPVSSTSLMTSSSGVEGGVSEVAIQMGESSDQQIASTSSTESIVVAFEEQQQQQRLMSNKSSDDSLLAIVSSQRERFRQRNQDLEAENISYKNRVQSLQDDLDLLRNDNLKLYEKIKFLQSNYSSSSSSASSSSLAVNASLGGLESRYASQYEQSLDPFQTFARKERNRKYGSMRPYEKATLALVRFILGSPLARTFAFFYSVFLHLLVFLVLYRFSTLQECHEESREDCAKQFADHMLHVHGSQT